MSYDWRRRRVQREDSIDDSVTVDILITIIAAGGHTISSILQSFFKIMALNPEVVRKAQLGRAMQGRFGLKTLKLAEIDEVVGLGRLPLWEDQASLPYVRGLIKQLPRCCGLGGLGT